MCELHEDYMMTFFCSYEKTKTAKKAKGFKMLFTYNESKRIMPITVAIENKMPITAVLVNFVFITTEQTSTEVKTIKK